jgi:hypothetical protein
MYSFAHLASQSIISSFFIKSSNQEIQINFFILIFQVIILIITKISNLFIDLVHIILGSELSQKNY